MHIVKELVGGILIIIVAGLIGIAQNTVRDDSLALVPTTSRAATKKFQGSQSIVKKDVNESASPSDDITSAEGMTTDWPTEAELASGELTMDRLLSFLEVENVIVVDARSDAEYQAGRITGAVNIPYDQLVDYYDQLKSTIPLDALIVCYCESVTCDNSENLAKELGFMGYINVLVYRGGWEEWEAAGNPVDGSPDD
jgi:rhodanese-related sulfurtransferase